MTLEAAAQIGEAVGGIAVVASLAYLVVQISLPSIAPGFRERWTHVRENYSDGFRETVESGLASLRAETAPR